MRILVTGAAGMLGDSLVPILEEESHNVYPTDINITDSKIKYLDVREIDEISKFVNLIKPDIIIHLAAETDLEVCEKNPDEAYRTNALGVQNVAIVCQEKNIPLIYISTAGVFDGHKEIPYTEFDEPNPLNVYGLSKLAGEHFVKALLNRYYIVRAGWMIGGGGEKDKKFVRKIISQIEEGKKEIYAVIDKRGTPTYAPAFSKVLAKLIRTNFYGLYHLACRGTATRYDVASKIIEFLGIDGLKLVPVNSDFFAKEYPTQRPNSEEMHNYMLELRGMDTMPMWEDALRQYLDLYFNHIPALLKSRDLP
ncbi:MAG: dTDP-4-dehydrorhamnose reductase [Nitrosotalea sp.]